MGDLVTISQLLGIMPFSRATLYRYIDEGLPYTIVNGKKKMFDPDVVAEFMSTRKETDIKLEVGHEYSNNEICDMFRVGIMGGIRKSNTKNAIVVISYPYNLRFKYKDYWEDDIFYYYGQGSQGDQDLSIGFNKALMQSKQLGSTVYLFESFTQGKYKYRGIVELAGDVKLEQVSDYNEDRVVLKFPLRLLNGNKYISEEYLDKEDAKEEERIKEMPPVELSEAAVKIKTPIQSREVVKKVITRNPYTIRYAKMRANGYCELCGAKAPFEVNGEPYLEVDHIIPLGKGGDDSIDNLSCLCPNCNRMKDKIVNDEMISIIRRNVARDEVEFQKKLHGEMK